MIDLKNIPTNEAHEVIEVVHTPLQDNVSTTDKEHDNAEPDPFPSAISDPAPIEDKVADDPTEIPVVELTPLDDDEDTISYNFKKHPLHSITQDMILEFNGWTTADELADMKGVHVQTIKRALDTMEKTDGVDILYDGEAWQSMMLETIPGLYLFVRCTRSKTGRYARGSPIEFRVILENSPEYEATRILFTTLPPMAIEEALEHVEQPSVPDYGIEITEDEIADAMEWDESIPDDYYAQDEPSVLEQVVVEKKGICVQCSKKATMFIETSVGGRMFCSEKCWAEYVGEPVMPEGHYALKENVAIPQGDRTEDVHDIRGMMGVN